MPDLKQALKDLVATSNSGKYTDEATLLSKFPELKGYDINSLRDFVATSNSGKYINDDELFSKFPEFNIVGVKKKESSTPDLQVGMEDLQDGFDFSQPTFEAPSVLTPKAQEEYIAEQKTKPAPVVETPTPDAIPKGFQTYQAPNKEDEQGLGLNILSSLNKGFYQNLIGNPIKGVGTLYEKAVSLLPRQIRSETGKGIISDSLIEFGNYFNKAIDEISPQDKEFKNSLTDQFAQAFGQVASTILTAGVGGAGSVASKGASMLVKPLGVKAAALAATKEAGKQIVSPVGISSALTMGQSEYERAKQAGASDEQAFEAFYKNAITGSVLETIPVMQFMKRFNNATQGGIINYIKTKGVAGLTGGVEEMTTEVLQGLYANKTAQEIYNENQNIFEGLTEAGGVGFGVGFLLNAMGANVRLLRKQGKNDEANALENQIETLQSQAESGPAPIYKINGLKIESPQIVNDMIERMSVSDLSKINIDITNDPVLKNKLQDKIVTSSIMEQVREANPELNEPSLKAITELEKQLTLLEGNKTQTGKDKAAAIRGQIKNIQENQLQEEAVAETITAETPEDAEIGKVEVAALKDVESTAKTMDDFDTFKDAVDYNVRRTADIGVDESEANYGNAKNINEIESELEKAGIQVEKVPQSSMSDGNYASFDGDKIKVTDENIPLQVLLHEIGEKVILDLDKAKQKIEHANNIFEAVTTYGASRGNDAFSDNFYLYFLSPKTLKDLSPNVYAELDKIIPDNIKDLGKSLMSKYGVTEQTLKYNKPQTDAIQKQTAGQVPVLTEAGVGEEVVQREPQAEPQGVAQEGVKAEVVGQFIIEPTERISWSKDGKEYKVGDVIDGNQLDELSGNLVGNVPNEKFVLVQEPLSKFDDNRESLLSQEKGYEQEEIDRLESMKANFDQTPPIPQEGDGMHRIVVAKELGNKTILMWKNVKNVSPAVSLETQPITRDNIRALTDEEVNPLYDEIPMNLLPIAENVSKQDAVFNAYFKSKQNNTNPNLVQAVEKTMTPTVSLETQLVPEEVAVEEQFVPLTSDDIEFDKRFSRDEASDVVEDEREGENGRSYTYISEVETPVSDVDGEQIGYLVKMVDDEKNLSFEARDENGNNLSKNEEGFSTLREAEKALLDNHNKSKKKEFDRNAKAKAKEKAKADAKAAAKKAKAETKKPAAPVKAEPSTETEEEQVARMMELFKKGAEATTDSGISITNKSQINSIKGEINDKLKLKVIESAQKALKTLRSVLPNFDIIIHENEGSYNAAMIARNGKPSEAGNFSIDKKGSYSGRIDINLERANARTVAHEVAHGIMLKVFGDTPALFKNFRDRISTVLKESANQKLIEFAAQYEGDVTYEEYLAELIGTLEQQEENISPSVLQKIAAIINAVISKISKGTFKPFEDVKNTKETIEFFSAIAKSIRQGEEIIPIDSKAMEEGVSLPIGSPVVISKSQVGEKVSFSKNAPALSFVTEADKIDINALIDEIVEKKQKVWFWMADQLGRGNYYDSVINKEHYLDAGPSFALDPENRSKGILWASGLREDNLSKQIAKADYIFFISGSPEVAKLFNRRVLDLVAERINKTSNFNDFRNAINNFKKETKEFNTIKNILSQFNSFKELAADKSSKRKEFLLAINEIRKLKTTPPGSLKELLESFNAFVDYNDLRDGFYRDNNFTQNDIMLVGKPTGLGGKAPHSTYEFAILGEVVGVPDKKIDSWNIMPQDTKDEYIEGNKFIDKKTGKEKIRKKLDVSQKTKIVAAETGVVRELESQAANRVKDLGGLLGFDLGKPVSKSQISNTPLPVNTEVANGYDVLKKKFGETAARAIRENIPFALDYPTEFAEFISKKIPVKEDIAFVVKNLSQRLDGLFRLESDKNIETVKVKNKTPEELSKEAGYVFHRPESENDILAFKKDFENGEVLCTYNDVEGRMQGHFIFWLRRNDAESVLPAKKITQEYLKGDSEGSSLWRGYLDAKGLKMPDGSYDISNLKASRQDPYGTSSMSVQIGRRGGNISIKNRYNHSVNNPDATFGNDLNTIIDGLNDAVFGIEGIPKQTNQELRLPDNITSDSQGRFFKYDQEIENVYVSQHGYVDDGEMTIIDKSYQRMIDNFVFDSKKNRVTAINMTTPLALNIDNVNFEKNKITVDSKDGKFELELLDGFLNKLESNTKIIENNFLRYNNTLQSISLPNVEAIGNNFLYDNKTLKSISLPNVKYIGYSFLEKNKDLDSISLPNVVEINDSFLYNNKLLENISLPKIENIGGAFLYNNEELKSISFPNVEDIGDEFLFHNLELKNISLPNVKTIRNSFIYYNDILDSISLPNVIEIGGAFLMNNKDLKSISLPNVKIIGEFFIRGNDLLNTINLPKVGFIGNNFLRDNYKLKSISLPSVKIIGDRFLQNNVTLESISLPNVEKIGKQFLYYNTDLKSISLPKIKTIDDYFLVNNEFGVERPYTIISKSQISSNNEINAAVNNFRTQGFSESAIKAFLIQQGYSATEANQIMNIGPIQEEFNSLMDKVDKLIARQKSRGIEDSKITSNIDTFIRKQDEYLNANDAQKKIIEREARAKMGAAPKRAVSIGRVLGALKDITNISRQEKLKIISQIRQLSKDAAKDLAKEIRSMKSSGKITANQAANIVARFGKVNMLSEISVSKFVDYMAKVFANAEYAAKLSSARSLKKDISKLSKDKNKNANLKDLGSKFIKINPSMVEDIDAYNDMASKIKEAIKGSTIRGEKVNFADTVNIENATEYINKTIEAQEEMIRQEKAAEIQELMGVDVSDLSYEDMILMLDSDKPITKYNEGIIRGAINKAFKIYSSIIKNTISTGKDPFTDEDVTFTKNQKRIVTEFMNMDLNQLEPKEALKAVDALVNFLQNNSIARMDTVVAEYNALVNSKKLVEDGVKARELKKYGLKGLGRLLAEQTTTLPVLFEKMFPGVNRSSYVRKMMGLTKLFNESASAKTEAKNIVNDYIKNFYKKKANGEAFNTVENNIERDMAARLIRTVIGTETEMQAEFDRRKEVLKESIAMLSEGNEQEVAKSILYQKVYDKLVGPSTGVNQNQKIDNEATNIQEVRDRVDKTNLEAIDFWIKNWGDRYDRFAEVSEGVYNTILEKELNYTPDKYSLLSLYSKDVDLNNEESAFNKNTGQEYKKSGTLNKVNQPGAEDLRKSNRYLNLDFDQNMANLMQDALIDINTAASIKQVMAFLNSPNFRKIFPNQDDATIIKGKDKTVGRVQLYINNLRSKNDFTTDELSSAMKKLDKVAALGVSFALGGVGQVPKQTFSVSVNTLFNSGSLPDLSILTNIDKMNFINNSGRDIANRGASSQTEIESINKLIEKAASSTGEKAMRFIEKINEKWLNLFLVNSDVFIAKASWLTYYEQSLKKQGIDTSGLDYKTHELNDKAADYASAQVGRQQNISDHDMAGKLFSNQNEFAKFVVKTVFSFASFRMNAASRLGADLTTLNDKTSTKEDRIIALRSIAAYGPELAMFSLVSIALNVLLGSLTKFISGDEEDEDELKKRIKLASKSRLSSAPSDILSPLPIFDPFIQKYIAAPILEKIEELTNLPVSIYDKPNNSGLFSEYGVLGIASERISKIIDLGKLAATGKYTDDYGNENTISEEKRKNLIPFVPLSILSSVGLLPQEGNTIAMNAMKYAKSKTLGDTALARRALKDWASMVDLNEYPQVAEFIKNKGEELSGSGAEFRKVKERNDLKKSLLEGYESETQMQEVDPELYQKNFGEESDWVKNGYATEDIIYSELNSELNTMINELKTQELRKKVND